MSLRVEMGAWLAAGIAAGFAAGWWLGNLWVWAFIGTGAGLALGAAVAKRSPAESSAAKGGDADEGAVEQVPPRLQVVEVEHLAEDE